MLRVGSFVTLGGERRGWAASASAGKRQLQTIDSG